MAMSFFTDNETVLRFLHVLSGITWIGMLYFFNFVNLPLLKLQLNKPYEVNMAEKATAPIIAKTLFFFRWGAAFTVLFGLALLYGHRIEYSDAMKSTDVAVRFPVYAILTGVLFGLIMAFNVWFVILPRQQKILVNNKAIAASADEAEKKRLGDANAPMVKEAVLASRIHTSLTVPLLWGMIFGAHAPPARQRAPGFSRWPSWPSCSS